MPKKKKKKVNKNPEYEYVGNSLKLVHRQLVSLKLKRALKKYEVVHHLDFNKKNNDIKNLMLITRSSHIKLHRYLRTIESKNIVKDTIDWLDEHRIKYIIFF